MFSNELVCNVLFYLNENINREISIDELSQFFYFNKTYIMKKFKKEIGLSIHAYINHMRIYHCLKLFKEDNSILKIALCNGFQSLEYFSETFKKIIGVSPTTYKKFVQAPTLLSAIEYRKIQESLISLQDLKNFSEMYLKNRKPQKAPVKKLFLQ